MPRILIINADDLGYDPAVTRGILSAMQDGVVTSATYMVNTPWSEEAARQAKGLSLGLHLNLARHAPLSPDFPAEQLGPNGALDEAKAAGIPVTVVTAETHAQLERFEALLGQKPTHLDVHKHLHQHANVLEGVMVAAAERRLPVRSITAGMRTLLRAQVKTNDHFIGEAGAEAYWTLERLLQWIPQLEDGVTELMCHPGHAPSQVNSGYAAQREVELATFVDPRAREALHQAGVTLADFRVLHT